MGLGLATGHELVGTLLRSAAVGVPLGRISMNTRYSGIALVVWACVLSAICPQVNADEVYIGLRQEALFSRLGLEVERVEFAFQEPKFPTLVYRFRDEGNYLGVAVHTSIQAARLAHITPASKC
jgi:hypothetical protein